MLSYQPSPEPPFMVYQTQDYLSRFHSILNQVIKEMTTAPLTDSISHNFIVQMILQAIITSQTRGILQMETLLQFQLCTDNRRSM